VKAIGVLTTLVLTAVAVLAAKVLVDSAPDIQRYLRMRSM
jgi:hypothetical protein